MPYAQQDRILDCISEKNIHGIRAVCKENGVAADLTERLEGLASLYGSLEETLPQAKALCCNEKMEQAVQELENILRCLKIGGNEEKVNLDFSIVNDMDYYTGIIFQGFINGVPSSILSGGRYDNLRGNWVRMRMPSALRFIWICWNALIPRKRNTMWIHSCFMRRARMWRLWRRRRRC